ncbi:hypothetical protein HPB50_016186 [Hyalomma asiaticum]|uniref:Uncharacterized protein n=1 Tax=Hyalomma asiaticum TaxID=266040 RepID=A0ACB7TIR2_HYAAI|nr:hypothetical protein HPB50_016186 [Hyalomma asiaticum]
MIASVAQRVPGTVPAPAGISRIHSRFYIFMLFVLQCSKCKENFQGVPTNGHQCYRHMRLEQDYCLDPETQGLATYVTVRDPREFLLVRNLRHRLVVTVPQNVYDLRSTRLYLVISGASEVPTRGSLFFRQDQTRIDLFVFFSVFFSCFFLFLAACVVVWKVKRAFDIRRARRLHAAQMEHMARRPFAKVCLSILDEEESGERIRSPLRKKPQRRALRDSPKGVPAPCGSVRPVAVEPTGDGAAAVTTLLVQLPGGLSAPVRLALASALVAVRSGGGGAAGGIRAAMRRRTSHINL